MDWTFDDGRAIYTQLVEQIEQAIVTGIYPPGSRMPGVRELAAEAGVNPNTMQRALAELETKGLLHTQRTNGRFVTDDAALIQTARTQLATQHATGYVQGMRALGFADDEIAYYVREAIT